MMTSEQLGELQSLVNWCNEYIGLFNLSLTVYDDIDIIGRISFDSSLKQFAYYAAELSNSD